MRPDGPRDPVAGPDSGPAPPFPLKLNGKVIAGFGRGSAELGIPTANIPIEGLTVGGNKDIESGIYFGWAGLSNSDATNAHPPRNQGDYKLMDSQIYGDMTSFAEKSDGQTNVNNGKKTDAGHGQVYPMVMSIGYNPVYDNPVRSVEVHIMHDFKIDFYESHMNLIILGFIRPEYDYVSKDALVDDIKTDINVAGKSLTRDAYVRYARDPYLLEFEGKSEVAS